MFIEINQWDPEITKNSLCGRCFGRRPIKQLLLVFLLLFTYSILSFLNMICVHSHTISSEIGLNKVLPKKKMIIYDEKNVVKSNTLSFNEEKN